MGADRPLELRALSPVATRRIEANGLSFTIDETGQGDSVALFLHGFPENRTAWQNQLPALADLGWRAVAPDLRGYGDSSRPKGRRAYNLDHLTTDVAAIFDVLGARRRLLIGHDWGGIIAWVAAARRVTPLDGLVVMNAPHPAVYRREARRSWKQVAKSWYVLFFQLPWLPEAALTARRGEAIARAFRKNVSDPAVFPDEVIQTLRRNILQPGAATAMLNYYRTNSGAVWTERYDRPIETPTLLIWGEKDFALDIALTEGNEPYVADFTLVRLPGVSHWVQYEAPAKVNTAMRGWLSDKGLVETAAGAEGSTFA